MLILRIMLATVCYRFGSWRLVLQTLSTRVGQDFEVEVQARFEAAVCSAFCRWCFVEVMKLNLGRDSAARFGQDFEFWVAWRCWCLVEIFSWCLVEIMKMKYDQDLCLNLWYDLKKLLLQDELTLGSIVPLAMFLLKAATKKEKLLRVESDIIPHIFIRHD